MCESVDSYLLAVGLATKLSIMLSQHAGLLRQQGLESRSRLYIMFSVYGHVLSVYDGFETGAAWSLLAGLTLSKGLFVNIQWKSRVGTHLGKR